MLIEQWQPVDYDEILYSLEKAQVINDWECWVDWHGPTNYDPVLVIVAIANSKTREAFALFHNYEDSKCLCFFETDFCRFSDHELEAFIRSTFTELEQR